MEMEKGGGWLQKCSPEQISSREAVQGGTWDCPAGGWSRAVCHRKGC